MAAETPVAYRAEPEAPANPEIRTYVQASLDPVATQGTEDLFAATADPILLEQIRRVVAAEAPLHLDDLARRLLTAWGWTRLTDRSRQRVEALLRALAQKGEVLLRGAFVWSPAELPEAFRGFRTTPEGGDPRDAERIPPEEVADAMLQVLKQNIALDREDLLRETARRFGYRRVTPKTTEGLVPGIEVLARRGACTVEEGRVCLR